MKSNYSCFESNQYELPSLKGSSALEQHERDLQAKLEPMHRMLDVAGLVNSGSRTAILASNANGYGKIDNSEASQFTLEAHRLADRLERNFSVQAPEIYSRATSDHLARAIANPDYANIFLLGHGSYGSWVAADKSVDWYDVGKMVDGHLKNGVFANLGCGHATSWNFIPLGRYAVSSGGTILGKDRAYATIDDMSDPKNYDALR